MEPVISCITLTFLLSSAYNIVSHIYIVDNQRIMFEQQNKIIKNQNLMMKKLSEKKDLGVETDVSKN
jgi:hypothetical protein